MKPKGWGKVIGILLLLVHTAVPGQQLHVTTTEVEFDNQPVKVKQLHQDKQGFVWLGTSQGLLRYTGTAYETYNLPDEPDTEKKQAVSAIYEDEQQLWVGYEDGTLAKKQGQQLIPVLKGGKHLTAPVAAILTGTDKTTWVATYGQGIYFGKGSHFYHLGTKQGLPDDYTYTLATDKKGRIWVGTDRGIAIITLTKNKPRIEVLNSEHGLPDNIVTSIQSLPAGKVMIGMQSAGITVYTPETRAFATPAKSINWTNGSITQLQHRHNGTWIGTDTNGLFWLSADGNTLRATTSKLKITDLLTDTEGQLWIADNSSTIIRANPVIRSIQELQTQNIHALLAARDKSIWFATNEGLFRKPENAPTEVYLSNRTKFQVVSLYEDEWGYIWVGTMGQGVLRLNPKTGNYTQLSINSGLVNENVLSITGRGRELWLATLGGVSKCLITGDGATDKPTYTFQNFTQENGLGINYIYQAFIDSKNRVWFATDGKGLTMLQNGKFTNFSAKHGLESKTVYSVTEDKAGAIWVSTLNAGVYKYDGQKFRNYSLKAGLHDLNITAIAADKQGNILLMNRQGLDVLNPETGDVLLYGKNVGISEPDPNLNVVSTGPDGRVWLGTQHGLFCYDPNFTTKQFKAVTRLQDVQVFFKSVLGQHTFGHDSNHLTFNYTGLWYQNPEDITYRIKLEGYDPDWTESRNHTITYPNLPPGKYKFQVISSATPAFPYKEAVSYEFRIKPPFWRTYWFYGVAFIVAGSGLYLFIKGREQRLRETERQEKDKVMFQFETLKSQVNPHFLFNSFNTLISTIEEDRDAAVTYVEKLSDFFRVMLTLREKNLIPLSQELDLIRDYAFLQQQRYRENLQVTITVPEANLNKLVAPLTLQLLLENAIKHNIISKARPLQVQVFVEGGFILVQNNFQPKLKPELSTNIGLQNIRKRYQLLRSQEIIVTQTEAYFTVSIPLIDEAEDGRTNY
ncbi:two-component regulator propeller domain-containing protein [Pontibacter sp. H259]|uniref:ligand-binding sensor domain-containing protein n=1 Tax=Pontibacter sp. H259 TaxID=3133421 RepID=UPI0030BEEDD3